MYTFKQKWTTDAFNIASPSPLETWLHLLIALEGTTRGIVCFALLHNSNWGRENSKGNSSKCFLGLIHFMLGFQGPNPKDTPITSVMKSTQVCQLCSGKYRSSSSHSHTHTPISACPTKNTEQNKISIKCAKKISIKSSSQWFSFCHLFLLWKFVCTI